MGAGSGLFPCLPGQWTVVGIAWGRGTGEGASPLPAQGRPREPPTPPAPSALLPRPRGAGAVRGDSHGKTLPGCGPGTRDLPERIGQGFPVSPDRDHDRFPGMVIVLRPTNSTSNRPSSPEWSVTITNLHTRRWCAWGLPYLHTDWPPQSIATSASPESRPTSTV